MSQNGQKPLIQPPAATNGTLETKRVGPPGCGHGKPLRGLKPAEDLPDFQGRFRRMFPLSQSVKPATYGRNDDESKKALLALGGSKDTLEQNIPSMTSAFDEPKDGLDAEESGIPALYTYFGQFVDHDITFDPVSLLTQHKDPDALRDFRTPAFDLDNVYGRGPDDQPYLYDNQHTKFLLGKPFANARHRDLQRNNDDPARALIGDPRNDENSIVSQFHGLMLNFHNRVVDEHSGSSFAKWQEIVRWHYQWVVMHDFLPKIVTQRVLDSLKTNGRYDPSKIKFFHYKKHPFMPIEFSAAAYRLGHSMIRPGYRLNDDALAAIFPVPADFPDADSTGAPIGLTGFQAVAPNHWIDWKRFIDISPARDNGKVPVKGHDADGTTKLRLQFAYRIDGSVVTPLSVLPPEIAKDPPSLAQRNLLRGFELGLPNGQSVARAMGLTPLREDEILIGKASNKSRDPTHDDDTGVHITSIPEYPAFKDNCPLWTYILAEAMLEKNKINLKTHTIGEIQVTTPQLGDVGGRIVAETFLGMLSGDQSSYLNGDPHWTPTIFNVGENFALKHIVAYALGLPSADAAT